MSGLALLLGLMTVFAPACPGDPVDALFAHYAGQQPGASVAVIKDGAIVFERAYGLANVETGERATPQTNFRLASITKQFTAMAILILAERKALSVDDPIGRHLPELAALAPKVTLRHLLTHTSGLPDYETLLPKNETKQVVDRDVLTVVAQQKGEITPGTKYSYNNTGYALLALVVERASKLSYAEFLRRNIFKPLKMTETVTYKAGAAIAHRAYGMPDDQSPTSAVLGDGGIYSSTRDLARWIDALDHSTLVDAKRFAEATTAHVPTDDPGISYGFGWKLGEQRSEKLVFHTGTTSGFKNALVWVPSRKLAVIVLTNRKHGQPLLLARLVLDHFWDH